MKTELRVALLAVTPNPVSTIYTACRQCYYPGWAWDMLETMEMDRGECPKKEEGIIYFEQQEEFVRDILASGHESPLEHVSFTFAVEGVSRSLTHQLVRHRLASYCVSKNTRISTSSQKTDKRTIEELFNMTKQYQDQMQLRCVDETTGDINYSPCKAIIYTGKKDLYRIRTAHGYEIETTLEHRFLTQEGWKRLGDIGVGHCVFINGEPTYKDYDWLYKKYHVENLSQEDIGKLCGVSSHTIRAWVRRHGLQKVPGEWSIGQVPPNKGMTKETYPPLMQTSVKMMGNTNSSNNTREKNSQWKEQNLSISGGYSRVQRYFQKTGVCELCGTQKFSTEFHHIDENPVNDSVSNIQELCQICHKIVHKQETRKRIVLSEIISIEYIGIDDTYDIEMYAPHHNFVANGFVVHNSQQSQRYVAETGEFDYLLPKLVERDLEAAGIAEDCFKDIQVAYDKLYNRMIALGYDKTKAAENARCVLPQATETKIVFTMNCRTLLNFFSLRLCTRAQEEIRELAKLMHEWCVDELPCVFEGTGAKCEVHKRCPENPKFSCGKYPQFEK